MLSLRFESIQVTQKMQSRISLGFVFLAVFCIVYKLLQNMIKNPVFTVIKYFSLECFKYIKYLNCALEHNNS